MGIKQAAHEKAENEFDFEKVKGFGALNFIWHNTKVMIEDTSISIEHIRKIVFFKGKPNITAINYSGLDKIELKSHFSLGDLISGIIVGVIGVVTEQYWGLLITALLVLFSYSKNIVITRKDGSKVTILNGGPLSGGNQTEFDRMIPMLTTKIGRQVYIKPVKV